ncbi:MAG: tetratricopeptide repeat protein, partial [Anaerolineae bacterium]|nr:tetratricopeptide repeat protein [Anaerolineae bacterium]
EHDISASQVMDLLSALVDHSLVSVQEWNGENRYGFLETVRQYALEKLQATGELASLRDKHLAYFLKLALQGEPYTWIGDPEWIRRFDAEFDNLRTSMEYALSCDPESAILLANSLGMFIDFTSRNFEFNSWIERISIMAESWPPGKMKAMALYFAGDRATYLEDYQHAQDLLESALEMAKELGDKKLVSLITHVLAVNNLRRGDWAQLRYYAEQRLAISRELGDNDGIAGSLWQLGESLCNSGNLKMGRMHLEQSLELARQENFPNCISFALESLSRLAFMEGEYPKARVMLTECAQIRRQMGFRSGLVWTLYRLGQVFLKERDAVQARALFDECLEIFDDMKDISGHLLYIDGNSGIAALTGQDERAARLFGASKAAAEKLNVVMTEFSRKVYEPLIATVRERLGETEFEKLWADGRTLTLEDAIELAKKQNP